MSVRTDTSDILHGITKSKKSIMGPDNVDDVDEAFRAITNAQYTVSKM